MCVCVCDICCEMESCCNRNNYQHSFQYCIVKFVLAIRCSFFTNYLFFFTKYANERFEVCYIV